MQGKTIYGYTLQRRLGIGGMAEVWYAENTIGKNAAVKILSKNLSDNAGIVERFRTEAEVMVKLNHTNIRQVYDYSEIEGRPAIIMEYLEGDDLKARMKQGQRFSDAELKKWWDQLVDALNYTHAKGIVHRDIKPGNIFVDNSGNIKLLDFGIAKVRESISTTQTGQKLGTLMYMSPEQVKDSKHIDYKTDVYSLAVTFLHLITGKRPYDSDTSSDFEISEQIVYKPLDMSGLPKEWRNFLAPYLEKQPEKRPELRPFEVVADKPAEPENPVDDEATIVDTGETIKEEKKEKINKEEKKEGKKKSKLWIAVAGIAAAIIAVVVLLQPSASDTNEQASSKDKKQPVESLYVITDIDGYGYIDKTGKVIVEPHYANATTFSEGRAAVQDYATGLWGVIDATGKEITGFEYDSIRDFHEGMAAVRIGDPKTGKWGYIDETGKIIVVPKYDNVIDFKEGMGRVKNNDNYGFVDKTGKEVVSPKYYQASVFDDGVAWISYHDGKKGFIDKTGKEYIIDYDGGILFFHEGLAQISINQKKGYIDKTGKIVIEPQYEYAYQFCEGVAWVYNDNYMSVIDKTGKTVIDNQGFFTFQYFSEGLCAVSINSFNEKKGYIDKSGSLVINPQFDVAGNFSDGIAIVGTINNNERKYGIIDKKGRFICDLKYKGIYGFYTDGLAIAQTDEGYGVIDKSGKEIIEPKYESISIIDGDVIFAMINTNYNIWCYFNSKGEVIYSYNIMTSSDVPLPPLPSRTIAIEL